MLVLIDESGCPGFKITRGSNPYFVVGMAVFTNFEEAERTSKAIADARIRLGVKPEFKFSKCSNSKRDAFFEAVAGHKFAVRALVVEKAKIYSPHLRTEHDDFYNFFVQKLIKNDGGLLRGAIVKIDGSGGRDFKRALNSYLRQELGPGKIAKVKFVDSHKDNLIQLADMVTGAIARSYTEKQYADRWREMIREKIDDIWEYK